MKTRLLLGALLVAGAAAACSDEGDADDVGRADPSQSPAEELHWTHEGAASWGGTCTTGSRQSPVDLTAPSEEDLVDLEIAYVPSEVHVANTGHTIQAGVGPDSWLGVDGEWFQLLQIHVHAPSEHTVDGRHAAAELHLVHQSEAGELAVVGVLVEEGAADPAMVPVLTDVPDQPGAERRPAAELDPTDLLPADRRTFRYDGSLTTPPCTEGVRWAVMREPVTWSAEQLESFTRLYAGSNRPVQPLGARELVADSTS